eukprot:CCRYP_015375-RA/>CCRYP_015375-RA protein AED:0.43 eAED:0.43 QI:0/-1/0/1/-1/1/1/0/350
MRLFIVAILSAILSAKQQASAFLGTSRTSLRVLLPCHNGQSPPLQAPLISKPRQVLPGGLRSLMLSATENEQSIRIDDKKKIEGRKNRVLLGYRAMVTAYLSAGIVSASRSGISSSLLRVIAGYIAMPTGISYILISAAANNRLGSDTYKRLNLALLEYSVVGLSAVTLGRGRNKVLALAFILSIINCIKGYAYGVLGWEKGNDTTLLKDIATGARETLKGFFSVPKNITAFGYLLVTTMVAALKFEKLIEVFKFIQANSIYAEGLAMPLARFNRLALLTLCLYTLKDAADRDRLGGTTFIELNCLCSLSLGVHFAFSSGGLVTPVGAISAFFSVFCAFNALKSHVMKKK